MNRSLVSLLLFLFIAVPQAQAQDLDRLFERVNGLWAERGRGDATRAAQYADPAKRKDFPMYEFAREPQLDGFQFTGEKTKVLVAVKVKSFIKEIAREVRETLVETWVWTNGNWFVQPEAGVNPFSVMSNNPEAKPITFTFQLEDRALNLGAHKQGDIISGTIGFKASREQLNVIRARGIPGLRIKDWQWNADNAGGKINFTIDTALLSQNISQEVTFDAAGPLVGFQRLISEDKATITAQIAGKIRIQQASLSDAARKGGFAEVEIENVSDARVTLLAIRHPATVTLGTELSNVVIEPGRKIVVPVQYINKSAAVDVELMLYLSQGVVPSNVLLFRLTSPDSKAAAQDGTGITRAQAEELLRQQNPQLQQLQQQIQQQNNR
jgi:hypothetical protein